ncbi:TetR/AcrR family transcriptional regulator [Massilia sp. METH4]|uniref:TetR/AcrR family transcriptional regulator n=1 Tax=Massilia sp. METH4 TaxID=3123041 RepID=UPI0030CC3B8B
MRTKSAERRHHILRVAAATFAELGVEATTMSEIVSRLGGSKATIYNYFPSKDELVQQVLAQSSELKLQQSFAALDPARPIDEALRHFARAYLAQLLTPEMLSAMRIAQQNAHKGGEGGTRFYAAGPKVGWTIMQQFLARHVEAGTLRPCDGWVAAMHLKGLIQGELLDRAMYGEKIVAVRAIHQAADRGVEAFLRAYRND